MEQDTVHSARLNFKFPLGPERPPQPGEVPGDRRALQLEGVRRGLPVQRGNQDEPRAQVRGLVVETSKTSSSSWSSPTLHNHHKVTTMSIIIM